jgi:hypothetical protein
MNNNQLDSLNLSTIKALEFLSQNKLAKINLRKYAFPIVIGSGNAYNAGQIIFANQKAIFANESNCKEVFKKYQDLIKKKIVKETVIISASGEKDSVWEIKLAKQKKLKTTLLTCSPSSSAAKLADEVIAFDKLTEPYTYNVSTYLSMILAASGEKAQDILSFILKLNLPKNFRKYRAYSFILPDEVSNVAAMLEIKKSELFGPNLSLRAFSYGEARHAKFVIRERDELVISLGENKYFGDPKSRLEIKNIKNIGPGLSMALGYFLIGLIQEAKPDYFGKHIKNFCADYGYKAYPGAKPFSVIVSGTNK